MERKSISKRLLNYFFRGLLLIAPISIIIYVVYLLFVFLDELIPVNVPGLGLVILLVGITFLGYLGSTFITEPIKRKANRLLDRVPLLKTMYTAINDLLSAFVGEKKSFSRPVLVKLNRESEVEKPGFITNESLGAIAKGTGKVAVYLPHSYNFSGNVFIVPVENVTPIDANTAEVMKFIVSGGVTDVGYRPHEKES
ncbi:MAG TPA: DUF502 domain-containing protein [Cryomorphaceae bacterium]|nr:DUF502 domain-containing protein [Cryomorphaceae bacterium]